MARRIHGPLVLHAVGLYRVAARLPDSLGSGNLAICILTGGRGKQRRLACTVPMTLRGCVRGAPQIWLEAPGIRGHGRRLPYWVYDARAMQHTHTSPNV